MVFLLLAACELLPTAPVPTPKPAPTSAPEPGPAPAPAPEPEPGARDCASDWQPPRSRRSNVSAPPWPEHTIGPCNCEDISDGGPMLDDCVTAELTCGDRVIGHTVGGVQRYDTRFYEAKHCWPATIDHDGGEERVYKLRMPSGEWRAWVTLYTPCADLDVAAIRFDGDTCPTLGSNTGACEMVPEPHTTSERIELTTQTRNGLEPTWWIVVEGKDTPGSQPEGAFELHVQCAPGLGGPVDPAKLITTSRE